MSCVTPGAASAPPQYTMPCMYPNFAQVLDIHRPHTLLTTNARRSGVLEYRYDDTQETVIVPNIWYNQTWQTRVEAIRFDAFLAEEQAQKYEKNPPRGVTPKMAADIARRYRKRAARIRSEADRMAAACVDGYPVQASRADLDYGPAVFQ